MTDAAIKNPLSPNNPAVMASEFSAIVYDMCLGQSGDLESSEFGSNARARPSSELDPVGSGISICVKAVTATSTTTEFSISPNTVSPPLTIINVVLSISVEGLCENSKAPPPP